MRKSTYSLVGALATVAIAISACAPDVTEPTSSATALTDGPSFAKKAAVSEDATIAWLIARVDQFNASQEAKGSTLRLDYPWLFRLGLGTDPFGRLRTGSRWSNPNVTYVLDESDYTTDVSSSLVEAALVSSFDSWNAIANTGVHATRIADPGGNFDVLDGTLTGTTCDDIFDVTSPNYVPGPPFQGDFQNPVADIVVGGWINPQYFISCLGSINIIGVTWTFFQADTDGDNYLDRLYVEQFYNPAFAWTTTNAVYLDFGAPIDIETIAVHENGHAHGLGHFGGPINRQPFKLKPNLRVFNPEAVMNPFYLGGEERSPLPTDVAGLRTLYARNH